MKLRPYSIKSLFTLLATFSILFISGCSSTSIFNKTAQLTDVNSSWLFKNCTDTDWKESSEFKFRNCSVISSDIRGVAYACDFSDGRSSGLFKNSSDGLSLLCGVSADGIESTGKIYTDGSSDTSLVGKMIVATAAVAAAAIVANAARGSSSGNYITPSVNQCNCPYDTASDGSRCGARSAWSRSGGRTPYCNIQMLTTQDYFDKQ